MTRRFTASICLSALLATGLAAAADPPTTPAADAASAEPSAPPLPSVDDPLLAPAPPAARLVRTWGEALRAVRERAPEIALARAEIARAEGVTRTTQARMLPSLTSTTTLSHHLLTGEGTRLGAGLTLERTTIPDPRTTWNSALQLRVPVFAPQAWYDTSTARRNEKTLRARMANAERLAIAAAAAAIVEVITAERLAEVSRVSLRTALVTSALYTRRQEAGAASAIDVLRAEQEAELARAQVIQADDTVLAARETLGQTLGSDEALGVPPELRLDLVASDARRTCRAADGVEARADVQAARQSVTIAERGLGSVDRAFLPTVDALSTATYLSSTDASPNQTHFTWTVGGVLSWTLYDGGARYGNRAQAHASVDSAQATLRDTRRRARVEVMQSTRIVKRTQAQALAAQRARDLAQRSLKLAQIAYLAGRGTSFDLIDSSRRLREAEIDLAVKELSVAQAEIAAFLALAVCDV